MSRGQATAHGMMILFIAAVIIVVTCILTDLIYKWIQRMRQQSTPAQTVKAIVIDKRTSRLELSLGTPNISQDSPEPRDAYVTFFFNGQQIEMAALDKVYIEAERGLEGMLTYKGRTAIGFNRLN